MSVFSTVTLRNEGEILSQTNKTEDIGQEGTCSSRHDGRHSSERREIAWIKNSDVKKEMKSITKRNKVK